MGQRLIARWSDWSGALTEHLVLRRTLDCIIGEGVVVSSADEAFAARYRIVCDPGWRARTVEVDLIGSERQLCLTCRGDGLWFNAESEVQPQLNGAVDVDLSATPFTNTLPIRRLGLNPGESAEIAAVYVRLPELTVETDLQRYTCLVAGRRYRYESLDNDFMREIETDDNGLVTLYPGLFRRIL